MRISTFFIRSSKASVIFSETSSFRWRRLQRSRPVLFLFGIFYAILANFQHIVKNAEEGVSVWVFFDEGIEDIRIQQIGDMIAKRPEVAKMEFISAQEAWESFRDEYLGEYGDGFTENPLENSANYQVYLNDEINFIDEEPILNYP